MNLFTVLFVVFLVLKLVGVIAWSWWLVCLPLIIYVLLMTYVVLRVRHLRRHQRASALAWVLAEQSRASALRHGIGRRE
jgi:hypothetical protein